MIFATLHLVGFNFSPFLLQKEQKSEAAHLFRVVAVALFEFTTKMGVSVHIDVSLDFSRWHMCARVLKGFHIRV